MERRPLAAPLGAGAQSGGRAPRARSLLHRRLAARVAAAALLLLALGAAALRLHAALGGRGRLLLLDGCRAGGRQGAEVG